MAATYVTTAELRSNLGIGTLYSDATVEEVCQTSEDLINQYLYSKSKKNTRHEIIHMVQLSLLMTHIN